jgi:hypothetical protein
MPTTSHPRRVKGPHVGIFWLLHGKLVIDSTPLNKAEPYGDHLIYPRRRAQLLESFRADGQFQSLSVEHCELFDLPDAAWTDYQVNGDLQALISRHAAFFRAIFVPSLSSSISDIGKRHTFADCLEQKLKKRLSELPTPLHSFVQVMVLAKHGSTDTPSIGGETLR